MVSKAFEVKKLKVWSIARPRACLDILVGFGYVQWHDACLSGEVEVCKALGIEKLVVESVSLLWELGMNCLMGTKSLGVCFSETIRSEIIRGEKAENYVSSVAWSYSGMSL